jgi:hypothetical protein
MASNTQNDDVDVLQDADIQTVLKTMLNRSQFRYGPALILKYILNCMCCRNSKANRENSSLKPHYFYEKTTSKLT